MLPEIQSGLASGTPQHQARALAALNAYLRARALAAGLAEPARLEKIW